MMWRTISLFVTLFVSTFFFPLLNPHAEKPNEFWLGELNWIAGIFKNGPLFVTVIGHYGS